jgi:hypothetical protein
MHLAPAQFLHLTGSRLAASPSKKSMQRFKIKIGEMLVPANARAETLSHSLFYRIKTLEKTIA